MTTRNEVVFSHLLHSEVYLTLHHHFRFVRQDTLVQQDLPEVDNDVFFVTTGGFLVHRWKLWGAMYAGSIGVGLSLLIILAHFDTIFLPRLWMHVFKDGSWIEQYLILLLMAFWAAALHICTSSLSIGEVRREYCVVHWQIPATTIM